MNDKRGWGLGEMEGEVRKPSLFLHVSEWGKGAGLMIYQLLILFFSHIKWIDWWKEVDIF